MGFEMRSSGLAMARGRLAMEFEIRRSTLLWNAGLLFFVVMNPTNKVALDSGRTFQIYTGILNIIRIEKLLYNPLILIKSRISKGALSS